MFSAHYLKNFLSESIHDSCAEIDLGQDMTPIDFEFTRSKVKVTWVSFVINYGNSFDGTSKNY